MADAGSIATYRQAGQYAVGSPWSGAALPLYKTLSYERPLPMTAGSTLNTSMAGVISGTVKQNGVALPNALVALYYRRNGQLIARQQASVAGTFSFSNLEVGLSDYYVVALDAGFNALIYDTIQAV
jgi:hypothetical protein